MAGNDDLSEPSEESEVAVLRAKLDASLAAGLVPNGWTHKIEWDADGASMRLAATAVFIVASAVAQAVVVECVGSMWRSRPKPVGWKPAPSQNGRDSGLAAAKSTPTHSYPCSLAQLSAALTSAWPTPLRRASGAVAVGPI